jgi:hypothetical protein
LIAIGAGRESLWKERLIALFGGRFEGPQHFSPEDLETLGLHLVFHRREKLFFFFFDVGAVSRRRLRASSAMACSS